MNPDQTQSSTSDQVPPHFHREDRIAEKDLVPNGDFVTVAPTWSAPEGTQVYYLVGTDFRIYRMMSGSWQVISSFTGFTSRAAAKMSADVALAGVSTPTQIVFNTKIFDGLSEFTITNPAYGFYPTIPAATTYYYQVNLKIAFDGAAAGEAMTAFIYKNGAEYTRETVSPGGNVAQGIMLSDLIPMTQNDNLQFYAACSNSARKILADGSQPGTHVSIHRFS